VCFQKYATFAYHDFDLAIFNQVMRNTIRGDFFQSSIVGGVYLRDHVPLILVLFLPFYALFQSPLFLLVLQTVFIGATGLSLWFVASRELRDGLVALFVLTVYLLYPPLGYINLFHFHAIALAPLFLVWAYYFFEKGSYRPFLTMLALGLLCREDVSFIVIAFGFLALFRRRELKWSAAPLLMGLAWGLFCFLYLIPRFRSGQEYLYLQFYGDFGNSLPNIIKGIVLRPVHAASVVLQPHKLAYLFQLLGPLIFLPLFSPLVLFPCLPNLFLFLLSSNPNAASIYYQYNALLIPFLFMALVYSLKRIGSVPAKRVVAVLLLLSTVVFSWLFGPQLHLFSKSWKKPVACLPREDFLASKKSEMLAKIPGGVPAATTFRYFAHLSNRETLECLHFVLCGRYGIYPERYEGRDDIEYAFIDFGEPTTFVRFYRPGQSAENFRRFLSGNDLGLVEIYDRLALYRRGEEDVFSLYERAGKNKLRAKKPLADFGGLELAGVNLEVVGGGNDRQVGLETLWTAVKKQGDDLSMYLRLVDSSGREVLRQPRSICYHLYPTSEWVEGETIRSNHLIALPPGLSPGPCRLEMLLIDKFPPCATRGFTAPPPSITKAGWLVIGELEI